MRANPCPVGVILFALSLSSCTSVPLTEIDAQPVTLPPSIPATNEPQGSEMVALDNVWNRYVNHTLGISFLVPKASYRLDADCEWRGDEQDGSYRPVTALVPVVVLEDGHRVIVTPAYFSELTQRTQVPSELGYRSRFAGCEFREVTTDLDRDPFHNSYAWEIRVASVESLADLEALIDEVFGECFSLGDMTPILDREQLQVQIRGDDLPIEESQCVMRAMYVVRYSPRHSRAAAWRTGQSVHFLSSPTYDGYDHEMLESFTFLP